MEDLASRLLAAADALAARVARIEDFDALSDEALVELHDVIAACDRGLDLYKSHAARQVARRSRRELGHSGLAARLGFANPEAMIQSVTGATGRQAASLVSIGRLLEETDAAEQLSDDEVASLGGILNVLPWEAPIIDALSAATLSVECADALRRGLGAPTERVSVETLRMLAEKLLAASSHLSADRLYRAARNERELADLDGVPARQQELYDRGGLRIFPCHDGMWRLTADLDPESAAVLTSALDPLTSPRRGGPRFTTPDDKARAQRIIDDPRTTERIALDGFLELVRLGLNADTGKLYGSVRPLVKIVVTRDDLMSGTGLAVVENNLQIVSVETADRAACNGDSVILTVDSGGMPLDLGRTRRLFSGRQREALAVRDGGCLWPHCEKPPSWAEAHHIEHWKRDNGKTNLADGVLLCRFHHMTLHDNHWEIERNGSTYWLIPPRPPRPPRGSGATAREPVLLKTKSLLVERMRPGDAS